MVAHEDTRPRAVRVHMSPLTRQTRNYLGLVGCIISILLVFIGIFPPLIELRNRDEEYERYVLPVEYEIANEAAGPLRLSLFAASGTSRALEGYVMGRMETLPNLSLPPAERILGQHFENFQYVGRTLRQNKPMLIMVALLPGGVYAFVSPEGFTAKNRDSLDPTDNEYHLEPTPVQTILNGYATLHGPFQQQGSDSSSLWNFTVRQPIYDRVDAKVTSNFWGFAVTMVNVSGILNRQPLKNNLAGNGTWKNMDHLITIENRNTGKILVVATSLHNPTDAEVREFIRVGTSVEVAPNHPFRITIRGRLYNKWFSPKNIALVVFAVLAGVVVSFALVVAVVLWCTQEYNAAAHAPKMTPFTMLTIGPRRGEELWDLAAEQMAEVTERLDRLLERQMVRHHAYQIQQVHPLTTSYVTRSVATAVQMAFSVIEELQHHPIDDPLRRLLGDEGSLLMSYAVHWCTDATVRVESLEGSYRYEGPDVVFGGRMWAFAAPGVVTASEAVVQALTRCGMGSVDACPLRTVHVLRSRSLCAVTNKERRRTDSAFLATIRVPYSAPTKIGAIAGMHTRSVDLQISSPVGKDELSGTDSEETLPPQTLFTLLDTRRSGLVMAAASAPRNLDEISPAAHPDFSMATAAVSSPEAGRTVSRMSSFGTGSWFARRNTTPASPEVHRSTSSPFSHQKKESTFLHPLTLTEPLPGAPSVLNLRLPNSKAAARRKNIPVFQGDAVTRALLQPLIPQSLDIALHTAFSQQFIALEVQYSEVRVLVYYFYVSYKILFRPLAAPERHNIFRRLVTAFGVPQQRILEHLAARCAIQLVQKVQRRAMWHRDRVS